MAFLGLNWLFWGVGVRTKNLFRSTHISEQPSFYMFLSILTFDFDLIFRSVCFIGAQMAYFWGWGKVKNSGRSTHTA